VKRSAFFAIVSVVVATVFVEPTCLTANEAKAPNFLFILADDLGYGDLGCYNPKSKIPTPHIDSLAKAGMKFTDAHAPAAVCIPTRYALLTGRYAFRNKKRLGRKTQIPPGRMTIAEILRKNGYRTGCVGKWHLGFQGHPAKDEKVELLGGPMDRGFDEYFGIPASLDIPPYYYIRGRHAIRAPTEKVAASNSEGWTRIQGAFWRAGGIAPGFRHIDVLPKFSEEVVRFLETHKSTHADIPFFLYLALAGPHTPWLPSKAFEGKSGASMYGDFTTEVDHHVGRVLAAIEKLGFAQSTVVVFTSDNGPVWYDQDVKRFEHASVGPLRGMKGDAWEGGHRMPFIVRWSGKIAAGSTSSATICQTDVFATFAALAGTSDLPDDAAEDSFDFSSILFGEAEDKPSRPPVIHQSSKRFLAIRDGKWKLIPALGSGGFSRPSRVKPGDGGPTGQLYDLSKDIGETTNLWAKHPEVVERLQKQLEKIQRDGRSRPRKQPGPK